MSDQPTVVLVHGAFADASSWNGVIERLQAKGLQVDGAREPAARSHGRLRLPQRRPRGDAGTGGARRPLVRGAVITNAAARE